MIGKAKSNKSLAATIEYNLKEKAELFFTNKLTGSNIEEYQTQMQDLQKCYQGYAKQLGIHVILSPHISEGKNLVHQQWKKIAGDYLINMNLKEHQAIGFIHSDKEHRHLHLVINKMNEQTFKLYHDSFIGKRTQKAADEIAQKMGLIRAMEIKQKNRLKQQQSKELATGIQPLGSKQLFKQELKTILENKNIKTVNDYFTAIKKAGFNFHLYHNKETQELRGYGIEKNKTKLDASTIGKEFTLKNLQSIFESNSKKFENNQTIDMGDALLKNTILSMSTQDNKIEKTNRQWEMGR